MDFLLIMLRGGLDALEDYILAHTLTCLVPAFFIAGAMSALFPKDKILKYLGEKTKAYISYPVAVVTGLFMAVCSCTVLPLFAGIRQRGAGLGPAVAFLYTAPATNILAIIYTGSLIGLDLALARIILSVSFASLIGMILSVSFKSEEKKFISSEPAPSISQTFTDGSEKVKSYRFWVFFLILVAILLFGASTLIGSTTKIIGLSILIAALLAIIIFWMPKEDTKSWLLETWSFSRKIIPLLIIGVFAAGILKTVIPEKFITTYVGGNRVSSNLMAVLFGVFMYFPTLVEVPMARTFLDLGMGRGPLLAYLLADPVISLPSILVISKLIGLKRILVYAGLITFFCTLAGLIYGFALTII
ncbi:MAG: hypothetical protein COS40_07255 [Deltaproteobacteria bacterium CG03_land_8_20_14_0_80_45_14]|nr:MAG: hypothetical protein COS40_07255 [Deltaproteobacteria bacterium CG03_land_8_20_14_0_80_45_14]